jgi:acetyltransferase
LSHDARRRLGPTLPGGAWEQHDVVVRGGEHVFVRPLRPEDAALYPDFLAAVAPEDMRLRFFGTMKTLSPDIFDRLTHLDYEKAMAFVALDEASGQLLGVVRLHRDPDRPEGEFAVLVRSALKGHGLGWLLMHRIVDYARANGFRRIHGEVLAENGAMLAMCAELGFHIADDPEQGGVKRVTLDLPAAQTTGNQPPARRV